MKQSTYESARVHRLMRGHIKIIIDFFCQPIPRIETWCRAYTTNYDPISFIEHGVTLYNVLDKSKYAKYFEEPTACRIQVRKRKEYGKSGKVFTKMVDCSGLAYEETNLVDTIDGMFVIRCHQWNGLNLSEYIERHRGD